MSLSTVMLIPILVQDYAAIHFKPLIAHLQKPLPSVVINIISPFARLMAQSSYLGHTSDPFSTFGPLVFSLGPTVLPFHHTYFEYLCATNAMEHALLAFVCLQDAPSNGSSGSFGGRPGNTVSLSAPVWLKDWIGVTYTCS